MSDEYTLNLTKKELQFLLSALRKYRADIFKLSLPINVTEDLNKIIKKAEFIFYEKEDGEKQ